MPYFYNYSSDVADNLCLKVQNKYYNMQLPSVLFKAEFEKIEKFTRKKISYISGNGTFVGLVLKNALYFGKQKP